MNQSELEYYFPVLNCDRGWLWDNIMEGKIIAAFIYDKGSSRWRVVEVRSYKVGDATQYFIGTEGVNYSGLEQTFEEFCEICGKLNLEWIEAGCGRCG